LSGVTTQDAPEPVFDVELVVALARGQDPGLPEDVARELAVLAEEHLRATGSLDAPEVARRLLADGPDVGATPAAVVARAAVQHCEERGLLAE
jgi:hypothetical protein